MKKMAIILATLISVTVPVFSYAAMNHDDHGSMDMDHSAQQGTVAHEEVVDGVKATFIIQSMAEAMKGMKMEMPALMKETHHIHVEFKDTKTGKALTKGDVKIKVLNPDKSEQLKDLVGMQGHFGADIDLSKKGKYGVMTKFQVKDGKVHQSKFWYTVK
jgi:hypothetical protein